MGATASLIHQARPEDNWTENDCYVSFLPAAHSYEQWLFFCFIKAGGRLGFYSGDPRTMLENDLPHLQPTFWPSVPRLVNLLYAKVKAQVEAAEGEKGELMRKVLAEKLVNIKKDGSYLHKQDHVFDEIRA